MLPPVCASCSGETPSSFGILTAIRPPGWHSSSSASRYRPHRTARWRGDSLLPCSADKGRKEKHETNETTITEDTATAPLIISLKREISFSELLWVPLHHWPISRTKSFFFLKGGVRFLFLCPPLSAVCIQVTGLHQSAISQVAHAVAHAVANVGSIRKH